MQENIVSTFLHLKGNPRACVWTEPLWGIPYNLYLPYVALYMRALGLTPAEIGYVTSISLVMQILASILSGALVDKMGRRLSTLIVDSLAWSIPTLIWAFAQSYSWFIVAALFNGLWRITANSWGLLLTEDSDSELVVRCFSIVQFMGLLSAFFAPLSKISVDIYGVIPTMRVLYLVSFVLMTLKFVVLYKIGTETEMGKRRIAKTKNQSVWQLIWGCRNVFLKLIREKHMLLTIGILAVFQIVSTLNSSFWAVYITEHLGVDEGNVALYTTLKSVIIMGLIFLVVPRVRFSSFRNPMLLAWATFAVSQMILLLAPNGATGGIMLIISVAAEAFSLSLLSPMVDSLLFVNADPEERARILGLIYGSMTLIVTGFPALAGKLSQINLAAPFWINLGMLALGAILTSLLWRERQRSA